MMDALHLLAGLESNDELHEARLIILLYAFRKADDFGEIEGLTKLAKLDFLLRYPVMLSRALNAKGKSDRAIQIEDHERTSVESEMVRYRFGPWDHRYRRFLNSLVGKGLVDIHVEGRKVVLRLTEQGVEVAQQLENESNFHAYVKRATVLKRHFDMTATNLMNFIYKTFPEILSLRSNQPIQ